MRGDRTMSSVWIVSLKRVLPLVFLLRARRRVPVPGTGSWYVCGAGLACVLPLIVVRWRGRADGIAPQ